MSIYPVKLSLWFPRGDENYENAKTSVKYAQCHRCKKRNIKYKTAIGHHSIPWGYGDIWCSVKCFNSRKRKGRI